MKSDDISGGGGENNADQFVRNKEKVTYQEMITKLHTAIKECKLQDINKIVRQRGINYNYDGKTILHLLIEYMNDDNIVVTPKNSVDNISGSKDTSPRLFKCLQRVLHRCTKCVQLLIECKNDDNIVNVEATQENNVDYILDGYEESSARRLFKCLQEVLSRQTKNVNLNILDSDNNTPVSILLKKTFRYDVEIKSKIISYFQKNEIFIDYDMPTQGNQTIRSLFNVFIPDMKIPSPIAIACYAGDVKVLKSLLKNSTALTNKADREPLLAIVVKELCKGKNNHDYNKCLDLLLEKETIHEYIDLLDEKHNSAMHYAVEANNDSVILKLLHVSIYAGSNKLSSDNEDVPVNLSSMKSEFVLQTIDPKIIEDYLDSCITTKMNQVTYNNYQLKFNYNSFNPIGNLEMSIFDFMSKSPQLQHLLQHPTVLSYIHFRWRKFKVVFYGILILNANYFIFAIMYFTFCNGWHCLPLPLWIVVITFKLIVLLSIILNVPYIILLLLLVLFPMSFFDNLQDFPFYKFSILLSAFGLLFCLKGAQLFILSKHFYLFQRVLVNFMKMMVFYAICIIAFAFAFYKNAHDLVVGAAQNQTADASTAENKNDYSFALNFETAHMALLKTIIMSTGEFDAGGEKFIPNYIFYCLFIFFIVAITIVLSNLLIGLAVNDTTDILKRADLDDIIFRIKFMSRNERIAIFLRKKFVNSNVIRKLSNKIYPVEKARWESGIIYPNRYLNNKKSMDASSREFSSYFRKIYRLFKNEREIGIKLFSKCRSNEQKIEIPENKTLVETIQLYIIRCFNIRSEDTVDARYENMEMATLTRPEDQPLSCANSTVQTKEIVKRTKISKKSINNPRSKELLSIITDANLLLKISKNQSGNIVQSPTTAASIPHATKYNEALAKPARIKLIRMENIDNNWTAESADTRILLAAALDGKKGKLDERQDTALSAAAIVMAHISPPPNWKQNTMNGIMLDGRKYHAKCVHDRTSPPDSHLRPDELCLNPIMFKNQIDLKLKPVIHMTCDGFSKRMLDVLEAEGDIHGILVGNDRSIGVMKIAAKLYLFNSHGRDNNNRAYTQEFLSNDNLLSLAKKLVEADQMSFHPIEAKFQSLKAKVKQTDLSIN